MKFVISEHLLELKVNVDLMQLLFLTFNFSKYFQRTDGNISTKGMFNLNTFTGVKRENHNMHSRISGHNLSHTALNNSFSLNLF